MENPVTSCLSLLRQGVSGLDNPQSVMFSFLWVFSRKPRLCLLPEASRQAHVGPKLAVIIGGSTSIHKSTTTFQRSTGKDWDRTTYRPGPNPSTDRCRFKILTAEQRTVLCIALITSTAPFDSFGITLTVFQERVHCPQSTNYYQDYLNSVAPTLFPHISRQLLVLLELLLPSSINIGVSRN